MNGTQLRYKRKRGTPRGPAIDDPNKNKVARTSIHWPLDKRHILEALVRGIKDGTYDRSLSSLVVDAVERQYAATTIGDLQALILSKYEDGRLQGPKLIKSFHAILDWELQYSTIPDIMDKWGVDRWQMAQLMSSYCLAIEEG